MSRDNKPPEQAPTAWMDSIESHLDLLCQLSSKLPAHERLEPEQIKKCAVLLNKFGYTWKMMLELNGFDFKTWSFKE